MAIRVLRWAAYLLLVLLLLCFALLLSLRFFPSSFIPLLQSAVKDASGYELSIDDLALQYAPLELKLTGVTVIDPAASEQPLVEMADGKVTVDLWRAIRGKHPYWSLHADDGSFLLLPSDEEKPAPAAESASALDILAFLSFFGISASDIKLLELKDGKTVSTRIDADFSRLDDNSIDASFSLKSPTQEIEFKGLLEYARVDERTHLRLTADKLDLSSLLAGGTKEAGKEAAETEEPAAAAGQKKSGSEAEAKPKPKPAEAPMSWAWLTQLGNIDLELAIAEVLLGADKISDLDVSLSFEPQQLWLKRLNAVIATEIDSQALEQKMAISGFVKPLDMVTTGADASTELKLDSEKIELGLNGKVNLNGVAENDLNVDLQIEDLQKFAALLPVASEAVSPLSLKAEVATEDNSYALNDLQLRYAKSDLDGDVKLSMTDEAIKLDSKLQSKLLHIPKPAGDEVEEEAPTGTESGKKEAGSPEQNEKSEAREFLLSKEAIDWHWLEIADFDVSLRADELKLFDAEFSKFETQTLAEDGSLAVKPFAAKFGGGGFSGALALNLAEQGADLDIGFDMSGVDLGAFGLTSKEQLEGGVTDVDIKLKGQGVSAHELAASLDGEVLLTVKEATIKNDTFELIGSDLVMETLSKLNPFAKSDPTTELECALVKFDVEDGVFKSQNQLVVETTKMEIIGDGSIDFNDESLNIGITPSTKGGVGVNIGSLVKFMKLGGTLASPAPAADAAGLMKSGAAIGAAASTGGLSIVAEGLAKQALNAGNACEKALQKAEEASTGEK